ncbi:flavo protein-like protein oxygenase [Westerdykella ornata]|uniref:Flavo protein-like protein oxygenase n=1 Tax=Westerdykella ornata TaxID=318751 RepID=A0A6A6JMF9_WESOR|nr:flavo protein-like protein oxygenase [Westerdykella ornata]KAF2276846.1 flavo protein-like protein oxygenase [Westerdykella ornata]
MADSNPAKPDLEPTIKRNPHPDFKTVEASRPPFNTSQKWHYTQTPSPSWTPGSGANTPAPPSASHREIDPYAPGRPVVHNYKLLISGIVPRPIGFVSTVSETGVKNLAPFSFFNTISHDPPLFVLGFSGGYNRPKDTLVNLLATKECTINIISEEYIEAANFTSINAPEGVSEWPLSGLTPVKGTCVGPERVKEAMFSVEAKLVESREWESKVTPGKKTGVLAIVEGVRFWVREDAVDEEGTVIDPAVLKPIGRMGGITFNRVTEGFELPRPSYEEVIKDPEVAKLVTPKADEKL